MMRPIILGAALTAALVTPAAAQDRQRSKSISP